MRVFIRNIFLSLILICAYSACSNTVQVINPSLEVQGSKLSEVNKAVRAALSNKQWIVVSSTPSSVTAKYSRGAISATIQVSFTTKNVNINLVSSENLSESQDPESGHVIHKRYMSWIRNLEREIQYEMAKSL